MADNDFCSTSGQSYPSDCDVKQGLRERAMSRQQGGERGYVWRACLPKAKSIQLLLLDVDGVLTDGTITYTHEGTEIKSFNTRDGLGIRLLREAGVETGLITARTSEAVLRRSQDLTLKYVFQKVVNKVAVYESLLAELKLQPEEVAYMGDDWLDLALLQRVGLSATVADGAFEVRERVDYITKREGGRGAVRELCDLILEAKDKHNLLLENYLK